MLGRLRSEPNSPAGEVEAILALLTDALERADALRLSMLGIKIEDARYHAELVARELPGSLNG